MTPPMSASRPGMPDLNPKQRIAWPARAGRRQPPEPATAADSTVTRRAVLNPSELFSQFNVAFSLMSIIPLLTCFYLITVRFFSIEILQGMNGMYFLLAIIF